MGWAFGFQYTRALNGVCTLQYWKQPLSVTRTSVPLEEWRRRSRSTPRDSTPGQFWSASPCPLPVHMASKISWSRHSTHHYSQTRRNHRQCLLCSRCVATSLYSALWPRHRSPPVEIWVLPIWNVIQTEHTLDPRYNALQYNVVSVITRLRSWISTFQRLTKAG